MNHKTVLVCDNDEKVLASIKTALEEQDFNVRTSTHPEELIEDAESHRAAVVIVNPDLPDFNAGDACKYLKNEKGIPVLFLMDYDSATRARMDGCAADDIVTKPVAFDDLTFLVSKHYTLSSQ